jgi:hypothetical protein
MLPPLLCAYRSQPGRSTAEQRDKLAPRPVFSGNFVQIGSRTIALSTAAAVAW